MPKLSIWNSGKKGNDYKFLDGTIREYFQIGGTAAYIHKYIGTYKFDADGNVIADAPASETDIQDVLFLENRDRRYAPDVIELRTIYNVNDAEFDLSQFGLVIQSDVVFLTFHLNDMIRNIGRKLMSGDVIELPHQRDDALLDPDAKAVNKYYVVQDASRLSEGYSQTWFPHVWRVKCSTLTNSQEYGDILNGDMTDGNGLPIDGTLADIISNSDKLQEINDEIVAEAKKYVKARYFETQQFWIVPGSDRGMEYPWVFAGDGIPPNGAQLVGSGAQFPLEASVGDYFLRTDYEPHVLYQRDTGVWKRIEIDYRQGDWSMANRLLLDFINNKKTARFTGDGYEDIRQEKVPLSKAVTPKSDF